MATIRKVKLYKIMGEDACLSELSVPTIALVGRSNVGKSSLINSLSGRKQLAYVSREPGKTRTINCYECNDGVFYLIDLPGYGYASVSKKMKQSWAKMIDRFFKEGSNISLVIVLIDSRRDVTDNDKIMINYLYNRRMPFLVILTKIDLLKKGTVNQSKARIANQLGIGIDDVFVYSSKTKEGEELIIRTLEGAIGAKIT